MIWWLKQKHIPSINNIAAYSRSVFNGLLVIVKNQLHYEENISIFLEPDCFTSYGNCGRTGSPALQLKDQHDFFFIVAWFELQKHIL